MTSIGLATPRRQGKKSGSMNATPTVANFPPERKSPPMVTIRTVSGAGFDVPSAAQFAEMEARSACSDAWSDALRHLPSSA